MRDRSGANGKVLVRRAGAFRALSCFSQRFRKAGYCRKAASEAYTSARLADFPGFRGRIAAQSLQQCALLHIITVNIHTEMQRRRKVRSASLQGEGAGD
ncbi:hypothetical protein DQG23_33940 [Paenibacillus contaminans]|uniref:Uncharacterized protein n=1 Tax=Paenibacillus contaminans TaxID=450362 RepID=A0A329M150_9BACL|nr:hypothetical protein DQG23_33940 [Paenibacillus contaminans]